MIVWCAYCQTFQGEAPPYSKMTLTHGMCATCSKSGLEWTEEESERIQTLAGLHRKFWKAGRDGDPDRIKDLAERGIQAGVRPIDLLFGFAAPALAKVGEMWANNTLTFEDEHRFTRSCEYLATLVAQQAGLASPDQDLQPGEDGSVLLASVQGSKHTLGPRFASLGLMSLGIRSHVLLHDTLPEALLEHALVGNHLVVGLSVALFTQAAALQLTVDTFLLDPRFEGRIVVAGGAVNEGLRLPVESPRLHFLDRPRFDEEVAALFRG